MAELLQNADDAGATRAAFLIDERRHSSQKVYKGGRMEELQGPALVAFNDEIFKEEHFNGLLSFGRGSKKLDPTKTGKFGLGFNSVYHVTEAPSFSTGDWWVILDPQRRYFPGLGSGSEPGMMIQPRTEEDKASLRDLYSAYEYSCFGAANPLEKYVKGTVFRFPLRTPKQARDSILRKNTPFTIQKVRKLFENFEQYAGLCVLFLRNIAQVELYRWADGARDPELLFNVAMKGSSHHLRKERNALNHWLKVNLDLWSKRNEDIDWRTSSRALVETLRSCRRSDIPRFTRKVILEYHTPKSTQEKRTEIWAVRTGVGAGQAWNIATSDKASARRDELALWPAAAVAALVSTTSGSIRHVEGRAFAGLPTPILTGYPVHVNARWCLSDNRNALQGTTRATSQETEASWNRALVSDVVATLWVELLDEMRSEACSTSQFYSLFPRRGQIESRPIWGDLLVPFYAAVAKGSFLKSCVEPGRWLDCANGFWTSSLTPLPSDSRESRTAWLRHIMISESSSFLRKRRSKFASSSSLPSKTSKIDDEMPPPPPFLALSSSSQERERPLTRLRRICRYYVSFLRERGRLYQTLMSAGCTSLVATPVAILEELQHVRKFDAACSLAREIDAADVREFLRNSWATSRSLPAILRADLRRVTGLLRFCIKGLQASASCDPAHLIGLPIPVIRNNGHVDFETLGCSADKYTIRFAGFYKDASDSKRVFDKCLVNDVSPQAAVSEFVSMLTRQKRTFGWFGMQCGSKNPDKVQLRTSSSSQNAWWRRGAGEAGDDDALKRSVMLDSPVTIGDDRENGTITFCGAPHLNAVYILCVPSSSPVRQGLKGRCDRDNLVLVEKGSSVEASRLLYDATFVHSSVRALLAPFAVGIAAETICIDKFGPKMLARHLGSALPATWKNRKIVQLPLIPSGASRDWIAWFRTLFKYLDEQNVTQIFFGESKYVETWPLLPCVVRSIADERSVLVSSRFARSILRQPLDSSGKTCKMSRKVSKMWNIAKRVGLPLLDDTRFSVPVGTADVRVVESKALLEAVSDAKRTLSKVLNIANGIESLTRDERWDLLTIFDDCVEELDDVLICNLRELPIFPLVDEDGSTSFVTLDMRKKYYTLPPSVTGVRTSDFTTMGVLSGKILALAPTLARRFDVTPLSFSKYYREYVFPKFSEMRDDEIITHMRDGVRPIFDSICDKDPSFMELCSNTSFIRCTPTSPLRSPRDLMDPDVRIFHSYFDESAFPPKHTSKSMLAFLRRLGMQSTFGARAFLRCAWDVATKRDVSKAKELLAHLSSHYDEFSAEIRGENGFRTSTISGDSIRSGSSSSGGGGDEGSLGEVNATSASVKNFFERISTLPICPVRSPSIPLRHEVVASQSPAITCLSERSPKDRNARVTLGSSWRLSFTVDSISAEGSKNRLGAKSEALLASVKTANADSTLGKGWVVALSVLQDSSQKTSEKIIVRVFNPISGAKIREITFLSQQIGIDAAIPFDMDIIAERGKHIVVKIDGKIMPQDKSPGAHDGYEDGVLNRNDFSIFVSSRLTRIMWTAWHRSTALIGDEDLDKWPKLLPPCFVRNASEYSYVWTQSPTLLWSRFGRALVSTLRRRLKMPLPTTREVVEHAASLCDILNTRSRSSSSTFATSYTLVSDLTKTMWELNHSLTDSLEVSGAPSGLAALIKERLANVPCIPLAKEQNRLVRPDQVFATPLAENVRPYAYDRVDIHRDIRYTTKLLTALNATESAPRSPTVSSWIRDMKQKYGDTPLTSEAFDLVVRLIRLFVSRRSDEVRTHSTHFTNASDDATDSTVFVPDFKGILRSSSELVTRDAPWLEKRLDMTRLPVAHAKIQSIPRASAMLGIASISTAVEETLEEGFVPKQTPSDVVKQWNRVVNSTAFRNGLRRIFLHESSTNMPVETSDRNAADSLIELSPELLQRLSDLSSLDIVAVEKLHTRFTHKGVDVTKDRSGAMYVFDSLKNRLYLRVAGVASYRILPELTMALRDVLAVRLRNLQSIEKMLGVEDTTDIPHVLDFLRITERSDERSAFLGVPLDREALERLDRIAPLDLKRIGLDVAFKNRSGTFCWGKLVGVEENGRDARVEVNSRSTLIFSTEDIYRIRDRSEMRAADMERMRRSSFPSKRDTKDRDEDESDRRFVYDGHEGGDEIDEDVEVTLVPSTNGERENETEKAESSRVLHALGDEWWESEKRLQEIMARENEDVEKTLEDQLPGVDNVLRRVVKVDPKAVAQSVSTGRTVKRGHDLVRVGNFSDGVAFFIARGSSLSPSLKTTLLQSIDALRDVCRCFAYNHKYITLFWQPNAISRFTRQKILINIWPIDEERKKAKANGATYDARKHPFAYLYIYGLLVHKLAHFHDAVHGTRHSFYMEEMRYEFNEDWIEMMESKGFDIASMEASGKWDRQLWGTQF